MAKNNQTKKVTLLKELIRSSITFESHEHKKVFDKIPDEIFRKILNVNFNNDFELAKKIISNETDDINREDLQKEIEEIKNYKESIDLFSKYLSENKKIIVVTDTDNDGSSAQAIANTFLRGYKEGYNKLPDIDIIYAQHYEHNPVRGITLDVVKQWIEQNNLDKDEDFLIVTADNGISSRVEQDKIMDYFGKANLLITDHHNPEKESVVYDSERSLVFDPKFEPKGYFKDKNISGAHVFSELLKGVTKNLDLKISNKIISYMNDIAYYSNMLDYVSSDIRFKPLKEYEISKYANIGVYLNLNNSLSKYILNDVTQKNIEEIGLEIPEINVEEIKDLVLQIKEQNVLAYKLIKIYENSLIEEEEKKQNPDEEYVSRDINIELLNEIAKEESIENNFDMNYISKLRPLILELNVNEEKSDYQTDIVEKMLEVFKNLKKIEKNLLKEVREVSLVNNIKRDYVDFVIPKSKKISHVFTRKFLGKAYNMPNNGFIMFVSQMEENVISGSFRSQYNISKILKDQSKIEKDLGIKIRVLGHERAAGFYITPSKEGDKLPENIITQVAEKINNSISKIEEKRKLDPTLYIESDFETMGMFDEINKKIRANIRNVESLPILVKIKPSDYFADAYTAETKNANAILKEQNYGYSVVKLDFHGKGLIVPNEIIRESQKNNFASYLNTEYMDDGAFIVNGVARFANPKNIVQLKTARAYRDILLDFYKDFYLQKSEDKESAENYSVEVENKDLKNIPFFQNNKYGNSDFRSVESTIINMLERTGHDYYSICDVEATGLGQSPKLTNIGFLNVHVDPKSGKKIKKETYDKCLFKTLNNKKYYVPNKNISKLKKVKEEDFIDLDSEVKKDVIISSKGDYYLPTKEASIDRVYNVIEDDSGNVIFNRELIGESIAILIKDNDAKVTPELAKLTNIDNKMLNAVGISTRVADKILVEKFKNKKIIYETHNGINYDGNVILSNLPDFSEMYQESLQVDSIMFSKEFQLAYDDVDVVEFRLPGMEFKFFYSDPYASYSLENFLKSDVDGVYPDFSGRYALKTEEDKVFFINKEKNEISLLPNSKKELSFDVSYAMREKKLSEIIKDIYEDKEEEEVKNKKQEEIFIDNKANEFVPEREKEKSQFQKLAKVASIPRTYRKYSVVKLSEQQMVRNLLLDSLPKKIYTEVPDDLTFTQEMEFIWEKFMMFYHFDKSIYKNMMHFKSTLEDEESEIFDANLPEFLKLTEDFIKDNTVMHERFKESWVVKKIVDNYDPEVDKPLNEDRIEMISWETSIPKTKVIEYLNLIKDFKKKYNLDDFYVEEQHNNVIHKLEGTKYENNKDIGLGDVILEGQVAINLNNNRLNNSYNLEQTISEDVLMDTLKNSTGKFVKNNLYETQMNSFSRRQAMTYKRKNYSQKIEKNKEVTEFKVKLNEKVMPQGTYIAFEENPELVEGFDMQEFEKKIDYIVKFNIIMNSLHNVTYKPETKEEEPFCVEKIILDNIDEYNKTAKEVYDNYGKFYFSKRGIESKKMFDSIFEALAVGKVPSRIPKMEYLEKKDVEMYTNYYEKAEKVLSKNEIPDGNKEAALNFIEKTLEKAQVCENRFALEEENAFIFRDKKINGLLDIKSNKKDVAKYIIRDSLELTRNSLSASVKKTPRYQKGIEDLNELNISNVKAKKKKVKV